MSWVDLPRVAAAGLQSLLASEQAVAILGHKETVEVFGGSRRPERWPSVQFSLSRSRLEPGARVLTAFVWIMLRSEKETDDAASVWSGLDGLERVLVEDMEAHPDRLVGNGVAHRITRLESFSAVWPADNEQDSAPFAVGGRVEIDFELYDGTLEG